MVRVLHFEDLPRSSLHDDMGSKLSEGGLCSVRDPSSEFITQLVSVRSVQKPRSNIHAVPTKL